MPLGGCTGSRNGGVRGAEVQKKDPKKYRDCCGFKLNRIRDVKQHLGRKHQLPSYYPRCSAVFPDETARNVHARLDPGPCPLRDFSLPEGVTEAQRQELAKKPNPRLGLSEEQQWFNVFRILFPGYAPLPASPYIDSELLLFQDFLISEGPRIISDLLTMQGAITWNLPNEERDLSAFQHLMLAEGLRQVTQRWPSLNATPVADVDPTPSDGSGGMDSTSSYASSSLDVGHRQAPQPLGPPAAHSLDHPGEQAQAFNWEDNLLTGLIPVSGNLGSSGLDLFMPFEPMEMSENGGHDEILRAFLAGGPQSPGSDS